ncbi:unnamed protein product, partial [Ectocarpus sp. 12 AP-2014]
MEPPQQQIGEQALYTQKDGAINPSSASGNPNGDFNMSADDVGSGSGGGADASNGVSDLAGLTAAKIGGKPPSEADKKAAPRSGGPAAGKPGKDGKGTSGKKKKTTENGERKKSKKSKKSGKHGEASADGAATGATPGSDKTTKGKTVASKTGSKTKGAVKKVAAASATKKKEGTTTSSGNKSKDRGRSDRDSRSPSWSSRSRSW